jgi:hypothetical protein
MNALVTRQLVSSKKPGKRYIEDNQRTVTVNVIKDTYRVPVQGGSMGRGGSGHSRAWVA